MAKQTLFAENAEQRDEHVVCNTGKKWNRGRNPAAV